MISCVVCTIGDELLIGQVIDTNSASIARALNQIGIPVNRMFSVGDEHKQILNALDDALKNADVLILTGGLGPTKDDITKKTLAEYTGSKHFYRSEVQEAHIEAISRRRGTAFLEINQAQADVPETCSVLENKLGTAPGMWFEHNGKVIISLPGVPYEMEGLLPLVTERLSARFSGRLLPIVHKTISTVGIPESVLAMQIADWEDALPAELHLAYLPSPLSGVRLRLSCYGDDHGSNRIDQALARLFPLLGNSVYSVSDEKLEAVIGNLLLQKKASVATAESCTGGKIASLLSSIPGASRYFKGSVVAYDNTIKEEVLHVPARLLAEHGAVSAPCVEAMATGVQKLFQTDYAIATSGIAGPDGGSPEKPVGTLWIAIATPLQCFSQKVVPPPSDRLRNIDRFAVAALNELRLAI